MSPSSPRRILLVNVHSGLNLGDDAIMRETLRALQDAYPQARIIIAANDPASWQGHPPAHCVGSLTSWVIKVQGGHWRGRPALASLYVGLLAACVLGYRMANRRLQFGSPGQRRLLAAYYEADLVLSCGGGNFSADRWLSPFFIWALLTLAFALGLGKRVVMLPQSIGPIPGSLQRLGARLVFGRVARVMVREPRSQDFVTHQLGLPAPLLIPDLGFGLPLATVESRRLPEAEAAALKVGVSVIDRAAQTRAFAGQLAYEETLERLLVWLAHEHGAALYFFCQSFGPSQDHDDRGAARRLADRLRSRADRVYVLDDFRSAPEIQSAYQQLDFAIGTRMHTGIFALGVGVPAILIGYQPKSCGMMEMFGLPEFCLDIETFTAEGLQDRITRLLSAPEDIQQRVQQGLVRTRAQLLGWVSHLEI